MAAHAEPETPSVAPVVDGRYEVRAELGRGSFGVVYAAEDVGLSRDVALKMVAAEWTADGRFAAALQREARALASLRSAHVVQVYAFGRHRDRFYFAMERVRGRSLWDIIDEHVRAGATVPLSRSLRILSQVAEGLSAVHAAGLLHLDVKPENIMIEDGTGRPVLVDFGLASRSEDLGALRGGTPGYMPPEQALRAVEPLTERSDVYALAATAYTLLTGAAPFGTGSLAEIVAAQIHGPSPRLSLRQPHLAYLDAALAKGLGAVAGERHESCAALVQALAVEPPARALIDDRAPVRSGGAVGLSAPSTLKSAGVGSRPSADTIIDAVASAPTRRLPHVDRRDVPLSILVIDPDATAVRLYRSAARIALFGKRFQVTTASGADGALAAAAKGPPDLAILRYSEAQDGIAALEALRGVPGAAAMRALVLSSPDGLRVSAFRFSVLGVRDFLPMPTSLPALVEMLGTIADGAGWRDARAGAGDREEQP